MTDKPGIAKGPERQGVFAGGDEHNTLSRIRYMVSTIAQRAEEIEREGSIPPVLLDDLLQAGCFRMLAPASHGGDEMSLVDVLRVIEALSNADGATGWSVGQIASAQLIFSYFPASTVDEIYAAGPDVVGAGAIAPKGRATRQKGGWRVTGQWPLVTGCKWASWLYVQCLLVEDRKMQLMANGMPDAAIMLFPASEVEIIDTWQAAGLRATASHDVRVSARFCPDGRSISLLHAKPSMSGVVFSIPPIDQGGLFIAAVAAGIAQGALDELKDLAGTGKRPAFSPQRLSESPVFQDRLGAAHMELRAARALLYNEAEAAWSAATHSRALQLLERASLRAAVAEVTTVAKRVVDVAYTLGGATAVYNRSPLQRRLRDIHAVTQHAQAGRYYYGIVGALLAGEEVDETLF